MVERVPSGTAVDLGGSNPSLDTWGRFCTLMIFIIKVQLWQEKKKSTITFIRPQILKMENTMLECTVRITLKMVIWVLGRKPDLKTTGMWW